MYMRRGWPGSGFPGTIPDPSMEHRGPEIHYQGHIFWVMPPSVLLGIFVVVVAVVSLFCLLFLLWGPYSAMLRAGHLHLEITTSNAQG